MIRELKLKINGMHCTACAMNIDGELEDAKGVLEATTSYAKQEVLLKYDDEKIDLDNIKNIVSKLGYSVII